MSEIYCKDCAYWDEMGQGSPTRMREGRCRRHAPHPHQSDMQEGEGTMWPATFEDDWCGESRPRTGLTDNPLDVDQFRDLF